MGFEEQFEGAAAVTLIVAALRSGLSLFRKILLMPFNFLTGVLTWDMNRRGTNVDPAFRPQFEMYKKRLEYQRIDPTAGIHGWDEKKWPGSTEHPLPPEHPTPEGRPVLTVDDDELWKE